MTAKVATTAALAAAINLATSGTGFRCVPVSWEDAQRTNVGGPEGEGLSCFGPNISDVRLWTKKGDLLYTLRSENWNERLGYVSADDVTLVVGNEKPEVEKNPTNTVSLATYLKNAGKYMGYVGFEDEALDLSSERLDRIFSIRFQTVFLPVATAEAEVEGTPPATEFCTEVYNYNTHSDQDPRNLTILATPQGTSVQADGKGCQKVFTHKVEDDGVIKRFWLEGEQSKHRVGGEQKETAEEQAEAASRGKAVSTAFGTSAMGSRFNVQMLVQLPLEQQVKETPRGSFLFSSCAGVPECAYAAAPADGIGICSAGSVNYSLFQRTRSLGDMVSKTVDSFAARVSRGSLHDVWNGLGDVFSNRQPKRDEGQHGTITVTMYNTVAADGVPTQEDITAAITDLNALYSKCAQTRKLSEAVEVTTKEPMA